MSNNDNFNNDSIDSGAGFFKSPFQHQNDLESLNEAEKILEEEFDVNPYATELSQISISKPVKQINTIQDDDVKVFPDETIEALSNSPKGKRSNDKLRMEEEQKTKNFINSDSEKKNGKDEKKNKKKDDKWSVSKDTLAMSAYDTHSVDDKKKKKNNKKEEKRKLEEAKREEKSEEKRKAEEAKKEAKLKKHKKDEDKNSAEAILKEITPIAPLMNKDKDEKDKKPDILDILKDSIDEKAADKIQSEEKRKFNEDEKLMSATATIVETNGESIEDIAYNNMYVPAEIVYDSFGNPDVVQTLNVALFDNNAKGQVVEEINNAKLVDLPVKNEGKAEDASQLEPKQEKDVFNMNTSNWIDDAALKEEERLAQNNLESLDEKGAKEIVDKAVEAANLTNEKTAISLDVKEENKKEITADNSDEEEPDVITTFKENTKKYEQAVDEAQNELKGESFVSPKDYEKVENGGIPDSFENYSTNSEYNPTEEAKDHIEKLLTQEDDGTNWQNSDDKIDENGIVEPPKMAKLAKLPQIIDYFISLKLKRESYVKIASFLTMAYNKFENSPENLQYIEICIKKIIPCLMIK